MLAKQTGLTRSQVYTYPSKYLDFLVTLSVLFKLNSLEIILQVSNWFINARVRLWKPMVEEMYTEELKEQEQNGSEDKTSKSNEDSASKSSAQQEKSPATENQTKSFNSKQDNSTNQNGAPAISISRASTSPVGGNVRNHSGFRLIGSSELEGITQGSPKKPRSNEMLHSPSSVPSISCMDIKPNAGNNEQVSMKFGDIERQSRDGYSFMGSQTNTQLGKWDGLMLSSSPHQGFPAMAFLSLLVFPTVKTSPCQEPITHFSPTRTFNWEEE
jgi:hypothetical protein